MSECVISPNTRNKSGYARCNVRRFGKRLNACHILAWVETHGRLPAPGMEICHTCDNPPCVNPEHLYEATHQQNMADCAAKGRNSMSVKTRCRCGRPYDFVGVQTTGRGTFRGCSECRRNRVRRYRARKRVSADV